VAIDPKTLDNYLGAYELAPDFILAVTPREITCLRRQRTGEGGSVSGMRSRFLLKVVDAQITFETDSKEKRPAWCCIRAGAIRPAESNKLAVSQLGIVRSTMVHLQNDAQEDSKMRGTHGLGIGGNISLRKRGCR
jgi:hypothetical protein